MIDLIVRHVAASIGFGNRTLQDTGPYFYPIISYLPVDYPNISDIVVISTKETDMTKEIFAKAIERRVNGGARADESVSLLNEIIANHDGDNLAFALHYNGFATARVAQKIAGGAA
jgi:hypothetical protein